MQAFTKRMGAKIVDKSPVECQCPAPYSERMLGSVLRWGFERLVRAVGLRDLIREEVEAGVLRSMRNIDYGLHTLAILDSAKFVYEHIPLHKRFTVQELRIEALNMAPAEGLILEFGVYSGRSINALAAHTDRTIYGFDSFEGLPDAWSQLGPGAFKLSKPPEVASNVKLVVGWFDDTLPGFLSEHSGPVAFLHLDCDLYASTKTVLAALRDRIHAGTVIVLDDFFTEPGWQREQHKAFFEFVTAENWAFEYIGYSVTTPSSSAALRLTGQGQKASRAKRTSAPA